MCGSGDMAALILHLRTAGMRMIGLEVTPRGKNTLYILNTTLGRLGEPVGAVCKKRKFSCSYQESNHTSSVIQHGFHDSAATQ